MPLPDRAKLAALLVTSMAAVACGDSTAPPGASSSVMGNVNVGGAGGAAMGTTTSTPLTTSTTGTTSTPLTTSTTGTTSATSGSTTSAGSGGACAVAPAASDLFEGASLDPSWAVLNPSLVDLSVSGGALSLRPNQYLLWYQESQGTLVSKPVTGDFKATTTVRARKASNPALPPDQHIHLAGLMARKPGNGSENYVFIVVGNDEVDLSVETKTTVNGVSTYDGPAWPSGDAELRICRIGATFRLYKRALGAPSWALAATYDRGDMPPTLDVGPNVYAAASQPDLRATFDEVRFEGVCDPAGCAED